MLPDLTLFGVGSYTAKSLHAIGQVAQLVERGPEKAGVGGSNPSLATIYPRLKEKVKRQKTGSGRLPFSFYLPNSTPVYRGQKFLIRSSRK